MHPRSGFYPLQFLHRPQHPPPHRVAVQVASLKHGARLHGGMDRRVLAVVVPLVVVAAVCRGKELEESRGLVPGAALAAAWVFGLGS